MRILITGGRTYSNVWKIYSELSRFLCVPDVRLIHGAAAGADSIADRVGKMFGWDVRPYPANWNQFGNSAGPLRNRQMLHEEEPELVLAFFDRPWEESSGTRDMVEVSRERQVPVIVFPWSRVRTRVVHCNLQPFTIFVGPPSVLANPFEVGRDGDLPTVTAKYRTYIQARPELMRLARSVKGETLGCWCHPLFCHANVIAEIADE